MRCRAGSSRSGCNSRASGSTVPILAATIGPSSQTGVGERENKGISSMKAISQPLTQRQAWKALAVHCEQLQKLHLRKLFADDRKRGERLTAQAARLFLDYSKNRITDETLKRLFGLARESGLPAAIEAMF